MAAFPDGLLDISGTGNETGVGEITRISLSEETTARLRCLIIDRHLPPGTRLREKELCSQFGVSRTPLREAFKVLAGEGLVELLPNRGAQVARVTVKQAEEAFQVLAALEALGGALAARNATEDDIAEIKAMHYTMVLHYRRGEREAYFQLNQMIHRKIMACAGNSVLDELHDKLNGRVRWARFSANLPEDRWAEAVQEHEAILEAFTARDGKRLGEILRTHIMSKFAAIAEQLPSELD